MKNWKNRAITLACVAGVMGGTAFAPEISAYAASETESNDKLESAQEIEQNTEVTGNLSDEEDKDYYKITLTEAGKVSYTFKTDNETGQYYYVCFCDENGKEMISEQRLYGSADNSYTSMNLGLSEGTYYVKVYWKLYTYDGFSTDDYHLTVNFEKVDDWEQEYNEDIDTATSIPLNTEFKGNLMNEDDRDYYKITLSEAGKVNYTFKTDNETGQYYYVSFCDENGKEIISEQRLYGSDGNSYTSMNMGLPKGTYYVKVYWKLFTYDGFSTDDYYLTVNYKNVNDWEQEYNEDYESATPIQLNTDTKGNLRSEDDKDCYKFVLDEAGKVSYTFRTENKTGQYSYICLYDENGKELADEQKVHGTPGNSYTSVNIGLPKGTYYVKVYWKLVLLDGFSTDDYHLKVNYEKADNWEVEYNEDFESANRIKASLETADSSRVSQEVFGSIRQKKDTDVYSFCLDTASTVSVGFRHKSLDSKAEYWNVYVYDKDGKEIAKYPVTGDLINQQILNKEELELDTGDYYVKVTCGNYDWSDIDYGLEIIATEKNNKNGLHKDADGKYRYYIDGKVATEFVGFVDYDDSKFYVNKGIYDDDFNGVMIDPNSDPYVWYFCAKGQVQTQHKGLAEYDGAWFYIENGKVADKMNKFVEYDGGLFAVGAGRIIKEYSGLMQDPENTKTGDWYFFANGQAQTQYTGLVQYDGHWFYVQKGKFDPAYNGKVTYDGAEFEVVNGEAQVQ